MRAINWRALLSRAPLPMLALAASYGVYSYNLLFVPPWVALVSAAAFELTYCGLAVVRLGPAQRRRAQWIATSAVAVSILYNTLAGLFHRHPELLVALPLGLDIGLAVLHGLPLALVAYSVADLLLHDAALADDRPAPLEQIPTQPAALPDEVRERAALPDDVREQATPLPRTSELSHRCPRCGAPISQAQYAAAVRRGAAWRGCAECRQQPVKRADARHVPEAPWARPEGQLPQSDGDEP